MKKSSTQALVVRPIVTTDGVFLAHYTEKGLAELNFPGKGSEVGRGFSRAANKKVFPAKIPAWHRLTEAALKKALTGHAPKKLPPLDWSGTTTFQQSVW